MLVLLICMAVATILIVRAVRLIKANTRAGVPWYQTNPQARIKSLTKWYLTREKVGREEVAIYTEKGYPDKAEHAAQQTAIALANIQHRIDTQRARIKN